MYEETVTSRTLFTGNLLRLRRDQVRLADGTESSREIVEHPGAVVVVPVTAETEVILVRQYRKAADEIMVELPAGTLEKGETPENCAKRELREETGYTAGTISYLLSFYSSPGFCTEKLHLYLAEDLSQGRSAPDFDENIEITRVPLTEAAGWIREGRIQDAKTIIGLREIEQYV